MSMDKKTTMALVDKLLELKALREKMEEVERQIYEILPQHHLVAIQTKEKKRNKQYISNLEEYLGEEYLGPV